ncbi:MAG: UDP-3-O-(3-hydroxymyristoyl)glucosamine N-acyltransferase [Ignavibacteriaceae bacterium]|jgi:UDP-3-O-[3-hydroxymyristoyl] glucosamine N-acyltransferase|nr:UDP-3-O-(3-hydroxymyristoyl)glucosamine N-acyltransferase [Ignavibacteriaceae bacterium]
MKLSIADIASLTNAKIVGDDPPKAGFISGIAKIEEAKEGELTFLYLSQYEKYFPTTKASAILVKPEFKKTRADIIYLEVPDPNKAFFKIISAYFAPKFPLEGIDATAFVHPSASVGENTALGKNVVISAGCKIGKNVKIFHNTVLLENVEVGDDSLLFQNVSIREECKIGKRVIIHSGTVIGSDGFSYTMENGAYVKIPQIGNVILEDDVELGSNVSVDRAVMGSTIIKQGTKIDNLVQIAHNVVVGEHTAISGQCGISGSTKVGKYCVFGGQVGVAGHIEITDNVLVAAKSGISKSVTKSGTYFGAPLKEIKDAFRQEAHIRNLEHYAKRIKELEKKVAEISEQLKNSLER